MMGRHFEPMDITVTVEEFGTLTATVAEPDDYYADDVGCGVSPVGAPGALMVGLVFIAAWCAIRAAAADGTGRASGAFVGFIE